MENIKYWIWFSIFNFKPKDKIDILNVFENKPEYIWNSKKEFLYEKLYKLEYSKKKIDKIVSDIILSRQKTNLEKLEQDLKNNNIKVLTFLDDMYPRRLLHIYDFPIVLYIKGNENILNNKSISIVGCRDATEYGIFIAKEISKSLSEKDIIVTSGLARGIDAYSHIGCILNKKPTIGVLGCGIDIIYPKENKKIYDEILINNGAIISEYYLGMGPRKENFPIRNRIVSGISDATVVVEAKIRSGSLITANIALEQGKEVYAVPREYYKYKFKRNK